MRHVAIYDCLSLGIKLTQRFDDFLLSEIQLTSYLSCLISLYDKNNSDLWEYKFISSDLGAPYSSELESALSLLVAQNFVQELDGGYYRINEIGSARFQFYKTLNQYFYRERYISAAYDSIVAMPFGKVRDALKYEPLLNTAQQSSNKKLLNDEFNPMMQHLFEQFFSLKTALENKYKDLLVPAVTWLTYLNDKQQNLSHYDT